MTTLLAASSDAGRRLVPDFTLSDHLGGTYRLSSRTGLGATIITNKRRVAADEFFTGMFSPCSSPPKSSPK